MNELAVAVAIVLFPGLIATIIADKITVHTKTWTTFKYSVYSFVFGVFCYTILQSFYSAIALGADWLGHNFTSRLSVWSLFDGNRSELKWHEVLFATALAPVVAFIAGAMVNLKILHRLAQKLGVSRKYGDENLYAYYLNAQEIDWIYVRDKERGLTYQGRVMSFSETAAIQELALFDVTVFAYEGSVELYSVPSIYLNRPHGSIVVEQIPEEFLKEQNGQAQAT